MKDIGLLGFVCTGGGQPVRLPTKSHSACGQEGAATWCCCFAANQTFPAQGFIENRKQSKTGHMGMGGWGWGDDGPLGKQCEIKTVGVYNPAHV